MAPQRAETTLLRDRRQLHDQHRALPGSYFDLSPAFIFDDVTFVDTNRKAAQFFADRDAVDGVVAENRDNATRDNATSTNWRFLQADYTDPLPLQDNSFDLLVSLYAGVVSESCARYLRPAGSCWRTPATATWRWLPWIRT